MLTDTILINMWLLVLTGFQMTIPSQLDHTEIGGGGRGFCGKSIFFSSTFFLFLKQRGAVVVEGGFYALMSSKCGKLRMGSRKRN